MIPVNTPLFIGNEAKYLQECIESGWIGDGPFIKRFEEEFARYIGRKYAIAVSSGTAALDAAVEALGIGPGDEVIVPTLAIISCVNQIVRNGAAPVFVDCDETWNMDVSQVEEKITPRTKAIMAVHTYGLPVDMDPLMEIAFRRKVTLIEDAAEVVGLIYDGTKCGAFGYVSCFSFYANKILTTGEGGMVLTDDEEMAARCRALRDLCHTPQNRFHHERLGWNLRMTNMQAAVGCAQLERIEDSIARKRVMGHWYDSLLAKLPVQRPIHKTVDAENIYWVYPIVTERLAKEVIHEMRELGVECRPFFWPLHMQPVLAGKYDPRDEYPEAEKAARRGLYLPSGMALTIDQIIEVSEALKQCV
jgi:perosamine synthetase